MVSSWRDYILQHFCEPLHRLTLVADPDGLLLEEELLATIRQCGFDVLPFEDHVAFRYAYESTYRRRWDEGQDTDLVVILRSASASLRALPYDLLQSGRLLAFSLPELFPKLSYPVIRDVDRAYLQPLYEAYQDYAGPEMGDRASALYVLRHGFGIIPDLIKTPVNLLKFLLSHHSRGERLPSRLKAVLLEALRPNATFARWTLEAIMHNASDFFAFLQDHWTSYLAARQPAGVMTMETREHYNLGDSVPFDAPEIRPYIDMLFLEGQLKPIDLPDGWVVEKWESIGVNRADSAGLPVSGLDRLGNLTDHLEATLPEITDTHRTWMLFAARWAELISLRYQDGLALTPTLTNRYHALHLEVERRFAEWMHLRYHTLHSLPFLPMPVMVHHIPHWMAVQQIEKPNRRLALLVVDGLALDQWRIIRDVWNAQGCGWLIQEHSAFAWAPTLTSISRQALFAGIAPQFFPNTWNKTDQDTAHWQRFWSEHGLPTGSIHYARNLGVKNLEPDGRLSADGSVVLEADVVTLLENPQTRVLGLVINTVDSMMHGMQLGTPGLHQQIRLWVTSHPYLSRLIERLLDASFTVYLTSDHGNVWARGIGRPSEGVLVETRGERARLYTDPAFLAAGMQQSPTAIAWTNVGLPAELKALLAPDLTAFLNAGEHAVCHGGIALEEVIVPFIEITRDPHGVQEQTI
jgi:hypothetical protein